MDLNEYAKQFATGLAGQFGQARDMASQGLSYAAGQIGEDLGQGAAILNDPRNAWIGLNPAGRIGMEGLGLLGGILRAAGGSREGLNPLLMQVWKRGEELSKLQAKVREAPDVFGFETPGQWRKSLHPDDLFSLWMHENTAKDLARSAVKQEDILSKGLPAAEGKDLQRFELDAMYPPGESYPTNAIGLNRIKLARERQPKK